MAKLLKKNLNRFGTINPRLIFLQSNLALLLVVVNDSQEIRIESFLHNNVTHAIPFKITNETVM